jgi:glycosyltransferase involved in cell wall biosynthesis
MATAAVTVVVPTFNRERTIERALRSVQAQTERNWKCVVVDNASTDETVSLAKRITSGDSRFSIEVGARNIGPVGNWLRGCSLAETPYVKFLYSDDELSPDCIEFLLAPLLSDPAAGFSYGLSQDGGQNDQCHRIGRNRYFWRAFVTHRLAPVTPTCALIRREHVLRALNMDPPHLEPGGFRETGVGYDQSTFFCAVEAGHGYASARAVCTVHGGEDSISISYWKKYRRDIFMDYYFWQRHYLKSSAAPQLLKLICLVGIGFWSARRRLTWQNS